MKKIIYKITYPITAVLLVASFGLAQEINSFKYPRDLKDEQHFRGYSVRIYRNEIGFGAAEILKNGSRVWSDAKGLVYRVGHVYERVMPGATDLRIGTDMTGDGGSDLVVSCWSGGAHCCFDFFVFRLEPEFKLLATLEGGHADKSAFIDLDRDSIPEFVTADWVFAYWHTSFAFSARPRIVLRYRNGRYQLAPDLMKKPPPTDKEIAATAHEICNKVQGDGFLDETDFGTMTTYFADLLYSGNAAKAENHLKVALCRGEYKPQDFLWEFSQQIKKSRYWSELSAIVGDLVQP